MKALLVVGLLGLSTSALAGKADTLAAFTKQAGKLGPHITDPDQAAKANTLCICRGDFARLGILTHIRIAGAGGLGIVVNCIVPRYNASTEELSSLDSCLDSGLGTSWDVIK